MTRELICEPLTADAFAPFGEVLETAGAEDVRINDGLCGRWHDRAMCAVSGGRLGISMFRSASRRLPYRLELVERHPLGSQAFVPMSRDPFLVIVTEGPKLRPRAFLTNGSQGVNYRPGTWHGVLTPLADPGLFAVIDRIAPPGETQDANLEEHRFETPWCVTSREA